MYRRITGPYSYLNSMMVTSCDSSPGCLKYIRMMSANNAEFIRARKLMKVCLGVYGTQPRNVGRCQEFTSQSWIRLVSKIC